MKQPTTALEWKAALELLERRLETPCVPGELEIWLADVHAAFETAAPAIVEQIDRDHPARFEEIVTDDSDLATRVTLLKKGDEETRTRLDELLLKLAHLSQAAPKIEPDERRLDEKRAAFTEQALAFVIHVRKQEVAIDTWLQEACFRDRGEGD